MREALRGFVVLEGESTAEDGEDLEAFSLERYGPEHVADEAYVTRAAARAEFLSHTESFSSTGYFGNEFDEALFYSFAAMEISIEASTTDALVGLSEAKRVVHAKFGEGVVTGERTSDEKTVLEIRFADGVTRKLDARFVKAV